MQLPFSPGIDPSTSWTKTSIRRGLRATAALGVILVASTASSQDPFALAEQNRARLESISCRITYLWEKMPDYGGEAGELVLPEKTVFVFRMKGGRTQLRQIAANKEEVTTDYWGDAKGQVGWTTKPRDSWHDVPQAVASSRSHLDQVVSPVSVGFLVEGIEAWRLGSEVNWRRRSETEVERREASKVTRVALDPHAGGLVKAVTNEHQDAGTTTHTEITDVLQVNGVWVPTGARISVTSKQRATTLLRLAVSFDDLRVNEEEDLPSKPDLKPGTRVLDAETGRSYRVGEDGTWELLGVDGSTAWTRLIAILLAAIGFYLVARRAARSRKQ